MNIVMPFTSPNYRIPTTRSRIYQFIRIVFAAPPGGLILMFVLFELGFQEAFHTDVVQGIGLTVGAVIGMVIAHKTHRNEMIDLISLVIGSVGFLLCLVWGIKEYVQLQSAVGLNFLPHIFSLLEAEIIGFGALCLIAVGFCGRKVKQRSV